MGINSDHCKCPAEEVPINTDICQLCGMFKVFEILHAACTYTWFVLSSYRSYGWRVYFSFFFQICYGGVCWFVPFEPWRANQLAPRLRIQLKAKEKNGRQMSCRPRNIKVPWHNTAITLWACFRKFWCTLNKVTRTPGSKSSFIVFVLLGFCCPLFNDAHLNSVSRQKKVVQANSYWWTCFFA